MELNVTTTEVHALRRGLGARMQVANRDYQPGVEGEASAHAMEMAELERLDQKLILTLAENPDG